MAEWALAHSFAWSGLRIFAGAAPAERFLHNSGLFPFCEQCPMRHYPGNLLTKIVTFLQKMLTAKLMFCPYMLSKYWKYRTIFSFSLRNPVLISRLMVSSLFRSEAGS
ncbi:MAG: hypothetical protein RQ899_01085 [Pseudomonadales bacterium]|nr:hypothetical protein [Pseudomonadales bacterium]